MADWLDAGLAFLGFDSQQSTNDANIQIARENRDWQERMSSTAHRREQRDLRLAGLNPILAAKTGGASTPSGSLATVSNPVMAGINSGLASARTRAELANLEETNENIKAQTRKLIAEKKNITEATKNLEQNNALKQVPEIVANTASTFLRNALSTVDKVANGPKDNRHNIGSKALQKTIEVWSDAFLPNSGKAVTRPKPNFKGFEKPKVYERRGKYDLR